MTGPTSGPESGPEPGQEPGAASSPQAPAPEESLIPGMSTAPGAEVTEQTEPAVSVEAPRKPAADRAARRAFRPRRVIPATITAALMVVIGALIAVEVISALLGKPVRWVPYDRLLSWASSTTWNDPVVMAIAGLITALGLLLVLLALVPGRPRLIPIRTGDPDLIVGMQPRGFTRALAHTARQVPGVDRATVKLRGRTAQVTAHSPLRDTTGLAQAVQRAVTERIAALGPSGDYPVRVNLRGK
ncbi:DUF6286 domain-containing protein [Streptosporangium sp. NPDC000396]|uniref:DUF6286 domain-containing protein n=1 Tax=Streptosporangium sp. NPDC000396 TaxID=3366185 RepID=UPI0036768104